MENRCIIVSGGVFGPAPEKQPGDFIIACDRGYAYCGRLGLMPDLFIGDFDSYSGAVAPGASVTILDEGTEITFLTHGTLRLKKRPGWGLSVFSLSDASTGVCLRGVKYELENAALDNRFPLGVSNEFDAPEAEIAVGQGILLVMQTKK